MARHITLVGMMGSGKSTVAPLVGEALKRPVIEVDALIEKHEGMPIGEIFAAKGEAYFRRVESQFIEKMLPLPPSVLSLGGGAFQWEATRELLLDHTAVFYLSATAEVLTSRLRAGTTFRPLLNAPGINLDETDSRSPDAARRQLRAGPLPGRDRFPSAGGRGEVDPPAARGV